MNKLVIFLGNKEKQWECKSLPFDFSSRNKQKKKKKLTKMLMETVLMINIRTMKIGNNSKSTHIGHREKKTNNNNDDKGSNDK